MKKVENHCLERLDALTCEMFLFKNYLGSKSAPPRQIQWRNSVGRIRAKHFAASTTAYIQMGSGRRRGNSAEYSVLIRS